MRPVERDPLSLFADAAGSMPTPELSSAELDRWVHVAVVASRGRRAKRARTFALVAIAASVSLILGVGGAMFASRDSEPVMASQDAPRPNELEFPTGDRIVRLGEGNLVVEHATEGMRRFSVSSGHALFDVAPLREGESFEVSTPHLRIAVVGTVFAVEVDPERTKVQVFDGVVRVTVSGRAPIELGRGESFESLSMGRLEWQSPLYFEGWDAARRHEAGRLLASASASASPRHPTLDEARGWLTEGEFTRARVAAESACARLPRDANWRLLLADSLRAERRLEESVRAYEHAVTLLPPSRATSAGYAAAHIRLQDLDDAEGAIAALENSGAPRSGSPIEERANALLIRAHLAAGNRDEAMRQAHRYLARYPSGASWDWVERLVREYP